MVPPPVLAVVRVYETLVNVAKTFWAEFIVTMQAPVPLHAPLQPANVEVPSEVAASVTDVPEEYAAEQVEPQFIPDGELVTVPDPVPVFETVNIFGFLVNVAVTLFAAFIVTMHAPVPEHAPVQPVKTDVESETADNETNEPESNDNTQVPKLQFSPAGELATVPEPVPAKFAVNV
jgi:hypothetical protein